MFELKYDSRDEEKLHIKDKTLLYNSAVLEDVRQKSVVINSIRTLDHGVEIIGSIGAPLNDSISLLVKINDIYYTVNKDVDYSKEKTYFNGNIYYRGESFVVVADIERDSSIKFILKGQDEYIDLGIKCKKALDAFKSNKDKKSFDIVCKDRKTLYLKKKSRTFLKKLILKQGD